MFESRILRTLLILTVLVVGGIAGKLALQSIEPNRQEKNIGPFSDARIFADQARSKLDYQTAAIHYRQMTVQDPYNSWAHFYLGKCLIELILEESRINPVPEASSEGNSAASDNADTNNSIRDEWHKEALSAFGASSGLRILRTASQYHVARLWYIDMDYDEAIRVLESLPPGESRYQQFMERDFVDLGNRTDFQELLRKDAANSR